MKTLRSRKPFCRKLRPVIPCASARHGAATLEIALSAMVVVFIGMGLYFMGQEGFVRLHHYVSTMTGMPYQ